MRIVPDGLFAHETAWQAWQDGESCCIVPSYFPDPTLYLLKYKGPAALFQYTPNASGGFDLLPNPWTNLQQRFDDNSYTDPYNSVTLSCYSNVWGWGLTLGRLYPLYKNKTVIPYKHRMSAMGRQIDGNGVTLLIGDVDLLVNTITQNPPEGDSLQAIVVPCKKASVAKAEALEQHYNVPVFSAWAFAQTGIIMFDRARDLKANQLGELKADGQIRGGILHVRTTTSSGFVDTGIEATLNGDMVEIA